MPHYNTVFQLGGNSIYHNRISDNRCRVNVANFPVVTDHFPRNANLKINTSMCFVFNWTLSLDYKNGISARFYCL